MPDCNPKCNEFFYSRMPNWFELMDIGICIIYLAWYILTVFISQDRCQYFVSGESIRDLLTILPVLTYGYDCDTTGLMLKAVSRTLRLFKLMVFVKSDGSSVNEKIKAIAVEMFITVICSTVLFMVIENFNINGDTMLTERYDFQLSLYYIIVTVSTVGYGDYYPVTEPGKAFIAALILYIIVYKLPVYIDEISELSNLSSPYQRARYPPNSEVPHIVISGQVVV